MAWDMHPEWRRPLTPQLWLDIACYGLAPASAARVRAEHLAHLEDALEAGETESQVLREWGDPHRANDAFCRAHLTVSDAGMLHPGYALSAAGWRRAVAEEIDGWVIPLFGVFLNQVAGWFVRALCGAGVILLLVPTIRWLLIAGLRLSGAARVVTAWLISSWGAALTLVGLFIRKFDLPVGPAAVALALLSLPWLWRLWAALRALHKERTATQY